MNAVRLERAGGVAAIVLDRPEARNALSTPMLTELTRLVQEVGSDERLDVVVLRAEGQDFCAGADLGDLSSIVAMSPKERAEAFEIGTTRHLQPLIRALLDLPQPVVASARGNAIGLGAAFLLVSDLVVLSDTARISFPQASLGHTLDHGESWLLPRRIGLARAMQVCLLGDRITANDAERWGIANWVVADRELLDRTEELVARLAGQPPVALRGTKAVLAADGRGTLEERFVAETRTAAACARTEDFAEAIRARLDDRPAHFTGL